MVYEIGSFIHDLRLERGYSQEELSYGICSTGNLSKIENGVRMPNRQTIEALMQRLGYNNVFLQFSSKEEMKQVELCQKIVTKLTARDFVGLEEIVKEFEATILDGDVLNFQYCQFAKTMINQEKGMQAEEVLQELESILQMTKPEYSVEAPEAKGLLTYTEIIILINIASCYADRDNKKAIQILLELKQYMDTHVLDMEERVKKYHLVIYNLSSLFVEEERYDEAIEICNLGIEDSKISNRLRLFPYFFLNKGFALLGKEEPEQAKEQLRMGCNVLEAMGAQKERERLTRYLEETWNFNSVL